MVASSESCDGCGISQLQSESFREQVALLICGLFEF